MPGSAADPEYLRLTWAHRRGTGFFAFSPARSSLWLGSDHVLCIDSTGYTETYKRFYFRDIQAVILCKTAHWRIWALAFGVLAGLFTLFALVVNDTVLSYILGTLAALSGLGSGLQLAAGPTCICRLRTAVQTEELPALNRIRRARNILARLRPLIATAQGELSALEVATRFQQELAAAAAGEASAAGEPSAPEDPGVPPQLTS
jgi:hypothetical protein